MDSFTPEMSPHKKRELAIRLRGAGIPYEPHWIDEYPYHLRNALSAKLNPIPLCYNEQCPYWVDVYTDSLLEPFASYQDGTLERDFNYCRLPTQALGTLQVVIDGLISFIAIEGHVLLNLLHPGTPEIEVVKL